MERLATNMACSVSVTQRQLRIQDTGDLLSPEMNRIILSFLECLHYQERGAAPLRLITPPCDKQEGPRPGMQMWMVHGQEKKGSAEVMASASPGLNTFHRAPGVRPMGYRKAIRHTRTG